MFLNICWSWIILILLLSDSSVYLFEHLFIHCIVGLPVMDGCSEKNFRRNTVKVTIMNKSQSSFASCFTTESFESRLTSTNITVHSVSTSTTVYTGIIGTLIDIIKAFVWLALLTPCQASSVKHLAYYFFSSLATFFYIFCWYGYQLQSASRQWIEKTKKRSLITHMLHIFFTGKHVYKLVYICLIYALSKTSS